VNTTEIHILPMDPGHFAVDVCEGAATTHHTVTVSEHLLDDLALPRAEPHRVVEESFAFLLEREPAQSILREFELTEISRYFPDYIPELRRRLSA
jgi:hypothetical protein